MIQKANKMIKINKSYSSFKKAMCVLLSSIMAVAPPVTAFCMALGVSSITARAELSESYDFDYYAVSESEQGTQIVLTEYYGSEKEIVIPSEIDGFKVVGLSGTFEGNNRVKAVVVPEGVENIDNYCFKNFSGSVTLPSTLRNIGKGAFRNAHLSEFEIPEGVVSIGSEAFDKAKFDNNELVLPDSLCYIAEMSFAECEITRLHIGPNLRLANVGYYSYGVGTNVYTAPLLEYSSMLACHDLLQLELDERNPYLKLVENVLYSNDMQYLIYHPANEEAKDFAIPNGVKYIMPYSCAATEFSGVSIGEDVEKICNNAFEFSYIESLEFGNAKSLKDIGNYAFYECEGMSNELVFPKSLERIGARAFQRCSMPSISFDTPSRCTTIGENAFCGCAQLCYAFIPNSVTTVSAPIESYLSSSGQLFYDCPALERIVFESNSRLSTINFNMFPNNEELVIDFGDNNSVTQLLGSYPKKLKTVDFGQLTGLTEICGSFFKNCTALSEVDLSSTALHSISNSCFYGCTKLRAVKLPPTVDTISYEAFRKCSSLESINLENVFSIGANAFTGTGIDVGNISSSEQTFGDFGYYEATDFIAISSYNGSSKNVVIPQEINGKRVEVITDKAFEKKGLTSVTLPSTLKRIGSGAFSGNTLISSVVIPDSVTIIGSDAFRNCSGVSELVLSHNLVEIGEFAFYNTGCEHITIPDSVVVIGDYALYGEEIRTINFGNGVNNIASIVDKLDYIETVNVSEGNPYYRSVNGVLYSKDMKELVCYPNGKNDETFCFEEGLEAVGNGVFENNIYLKKPVFPSTLKSIGALAYSDSIEELVIPSSVTSISDYAFAYCKNLRSVHFEDGFCSDLLAFTFSNCKALESVTFGNDVNIYALCSTFEYTAVKNIDLKCNVSALDGTFIGSALEEIRLYDGVEVIVCAFALTQLESIDIPQSVKVLGESSFEGCSRLSQVNVGRVKNIERHAFENCVSLETIDLTGVEIVSPEAFNGCTNLTKLYFTKNEGSVAITENEFQGNETIKTIVVGNGVSEIKSLAFADCSMLENAYIASSVTEISDNAFENCIKLSIICEENSYAKAYAERNSIPYTTFVVAPIPDQTYTGSEIRPSLDVTAQDRVLSAGSDYITDYSDNINVGIARVNVIGLGDFSIFATLSRFNIVESSNNGSENGNGNSNDNNNAKPTAPSTSGNSSTAPADNSGHHNADSSQTNGNATAPVSNTDNQNGASQSAQSSSIADIGNDPGDIPTDTDETAEGEEKNEEIVKNDEEEKDTPDTDEPPSAAENSEDEDLSFFRRALEKIKSFFQMIIDFFKTLFS